MLVVDIGTGMSAALVSRALEFMGATIFRITPEGYVEDHYRAEPLWRARNKRVSPSDLEALLAVADICITGGEDFPDVQSPAGISSIEADFPRLVILDMSAFGVADPHRRHRAVDLLVQARAGFVWEQQSDRPIAFGCPLPTYGMVLQGLVGVLAALIERTVSGLGQTVSTSLLQGGAMYWAHLWLEADSPVSAFDRLVPKDVRHLVFRCSDGEYVQFAMGAPGSLAKLYSVLDIKVQVDPLDRGAPIPTRGALNYFGDIDTIERHVAPFTRDELLRELWKAGFAAEAVLAPGEFWNDEQSRIMRITEVNSAFGECVASPWRIARTACRNESQPLPEPEGAKSEQGPLSGIRIVDFGAVVAGPFASALLADLGADVIKVEPVTGDFNRVQPRTTIIANRRKRSLAIDAKSETGAFIIERLCASADAVANNFRTGVPARLGIDPSRLQALRPDIVALETTAYGPEGPKAALPGFDMMMQAYCGHEIRAGGLGNRPHCCRAFIVDLTAGALGAIGLLDGLLRQKVAGQGTVCGTSLLEAGAFLMSELVITPDGDRAGAPLLDHEQAGFTPYERLYRTRDGWIAVAVRSDAMGARFARCLGLELPADRLSWGAREQESLEKRCHHYGTDDIIPLLRKCDVWAEPCRESGWKDFPALAEEHGASMLCSVSDKENGLVKGWLGPFFSLSRTELSNHRPFSPALGEHTSEILEELGISSLEQKGKGHPVTVQEPETSSPIDDLPLSGG